LRERRNYLVLLGFIVLLLVGVGFLALPGSPAQRELTKGLDLQGGLEVVLKAVPPKGKKLTREDLDRSVSIMRSRVDKLGVSEPEIRKQDPDEIVIELAGVHDVNRAAEIIGKTAQLELYDLETSLTGPSVTAQREPNPVFSRFQLLAPVQAQARKGQPEQFYVFNTGRGNALVGGPFTTRAEAERLIARRIVRAPVAKPRVRTAQAVEPKPATTAKAKAKPAPEAEGHAEAEAAGPADEGGAAEGAEGAGGAGEDGDRDLHGGGSLLSGSAGGFCPEPGADGVLPVQARSGQGCPADDGTI
jgi:hypothetical protein